MSTIALALGEYDLADRNRRAAEIIQSYAVLHAGTDALLGLGGFLPLPGAAPASMIVALGAQIPIYRSLAGVLSGIYETPEDTISRRYLYGGMALDTALTVAADAATQAASDLASQFGMAFLAEIGSHLLGEMLLGFCGSFVPILGGFLSMGLDVAIAATMTWRVGTMISIYYQNGGRWVRSRKETYPIAKRLTGGLSVKTVDRVDLNKIPKAAPEVFNHLVEQLMQFVQTHKEVGTPREKVHEMLVRKAFPRELIDEAINRVMGKG